MTKPSPLQLASAASQSFSFWSLLWSRHSTALVSVAGQQQFLLEVSVATVVLALCGVLCAVFVGLAGGGGTAGLRDWQQGVGMGTARPS